MGLYWVVFDHSSSPMASVMASVTLYVVIGLPTNIIPIVYVDRVSEVLKNMKSND